MFPSMGMCGLAALGPRGPLSQMGLLEGCCSDGGTASETLRWPPLLPEVGAELVGWSSPACPEGWDPWGPEWWCARKVSSGVPSAPGLYTLRGPFNSVLPSGGVRARCPRLCRAPLASTPCEGPNSSYAFRGLVVGGPDIYMKNKQPGTIYHSNPR